MVKLSEESFKLASEIELFLTSSLNADSGSAPSVKCIFDSSYSPRYKIRDYILEIVRSFNIEPQILVCACIYIDRFLSKVRLQLNNRNVNKFLIN